MLKNPQPPNHLFRGKTHTIDGRAAPREQHKQSRILSGESAPKQTYFRCDRYFTVGHEWYVTTREGSDMGPYLTRDDAELSLAKYIAANCLNTPGGVAMLQDNDGQDTTAFAVLVCELARFLEQCLLRSKNSAYVWAQQRLWELRKHPTEWNHAEIRSKALENLLVELDGEETC